jgi:arylsulfatase A-like enzyme
LEPLGQDGDYLTDKLTDRALDILDGVAGRQPFFLNMWFYSVHTPLEGKPADVSAYAKHITSQHKHRNASYAAMVHALDQNVGRLLAKLEEKNVARNTIIFFLSDNGGSVGTWKGQSVPITDNSPLRSGKGSLYEGGLRIPFIVKWPGHIPAGTVSDQPVFTCDLYPTILNMLDLEPDPNHVPDGLDLTAVLTRPQTRLPQRTLFFYYPHYYSTTTPVSAIRSGNWKLLEYFTGQHVELFNLDQDLGESRNLAKTEPQMRDALLLQLRTWRQTVGAQMPVPNPQSPRR